MQKKTKNKILSFLLLPILLVAPIIFSGCTNKDNAALVQLIPLEIWGVFDDSDIFNQLGKDYSTFHPNIKINYRKIAVSSEDYEDEIIEALANNRGPDIIFVKNTWLLKHKNKLAPLPNSKNHLSTFKTNFVDVAYHDFVDEELIYAMPLYCDTLALFYNRDILTQAGIVNPPATWDQVKEYTQKLTRIDDFGNIQQSAIALGRSGAPGAINRSSDIISLLMMQSGSRMNSGKGSALNSSNIRVSSPATKAVDFYLQFSKPDSMFYTWNTRMPQSVDAFRFGRVAMMINFSYMHGRLKKTDPKLNFEIAPVPQMNLNKKVNFGSYWGLGVLANKRPSQNFSNNQRVAVAWDFIKYLTEKNTDNLKRDPMVKYLQTTQKPTARKDLIAWQSRSPKLKPFVDQVLTAQSWYQPDEAVVNKVLIDMINGIITGKYPSTQQAISAADSKINTTLRKVQR